MLTMIKNLSKIAGCTLAALTVIAIIGMIVDPNKKAHVVAKITADPTPVAAAKPEPPPRLQLMRGQTYIAKKSWIGAVNFEDHEEILKAAQANDTQFVMQMILARRAAVVNVGESALLVDRKGFVDRWVQIRAANRAQRIWVPELVLTGGAN